jgi:YHS domain-containing protein
MTKHLFVFFIIISLNLFAETAANLNKAGVILDGYDPVSYFKSEKPVKGSSKFQFKQGQITYWFSSQINRDTFAKDPKKYEPQFGGWCAYAVADSKSKVDIDPESFVIQDDRLLLFYNGFWGDTRDKWLHTETKNPKIYLKDADANWPITEKKEP